MTRTNGFFDKVRNFSSLIALAALLVSLTGNYFQCQNYNALAATNNEKIRENKESIKILCEKQTTTATQVEVMKSQYDEIIKRLDKIDKKLDEKK